MSVDLEKTILQEILITDKDNQIEYLTQLGLKDFQDERWQQLFKVFCEISVSGKHIEQIEVYKRSKSFMDAAEISALVMGNITDAFLQQHIYQLKEITYKRELFKSLNQNIETLKNAHNLDETEEAKNKIISDLSSISVSDVSKFVNFQEMRQKLFDNIENNSEIEGISWGIEALNVYTSGIIVPRLYIIGGLKKGGKSRFVINTIKNLSLAEVKNVFLSLEMPAFEIIKLIHSNFTQIDDVKLRSKSFISNEEKHKLKNTFIPTQYFDVECAPGIALDGVLSRIRKYSKLGYQVIFIDYLQRIRHNRNNQAQELEDISTRIADATRANNVSVVLLSQLANVAEREAPTVGHLKGSGGIGEAADTIMLFDNLYRRTKNDADKNKIDVYIEQRYGDSGVVHLYADLGTCTMGDLDPEHIKNYRGNYADD